MCNCYFHFANLICGKAAVDGYFISPRYRMKALQEALGPVGMVKFMQQYDMGYGDYTKEKQEQPDMSLEEIDLLLKNVDNH